MRVRVSGSEAPGTGAFSQGYYMRVNETEVAAGVWGHDWALPCAPSAFPTAVDRGDPEGLGSSEKAGVAGPPLNVSPEPAPLRKLSLPTPSFTHEPLAVG